MDEEMAKLTKYVDCVANLAASLEQDIKAGNTISSKTVLNLSKLVASANAVEKSLSMLDNRGRLQ